MSKCVLIVDDSPSIRNCVRRTLEAVNGLEVCGEAVNGKDAIQKAGEFKPDLVVLDLSMPVMNGLQASRELTRMLPGVPLVMFTSFETAQLQAEAMNAGIATVVSKSEPIQHLVHSIQSLLK